MGKNTMMRKAIRGHLENNAQLEKLLPHIKGNVGFVFTKGDLAEVCDKLLESKVRAPARAGAIAPLPVIIPAQNTGLGPEKTSFFQALSIPTKISKGTIEIINDVPFLKLGDKVGASEATLLNMLNISPFSYGLISTQVYDSGSIFSPEILDIKPEDLRAKFQAGVANLAAVSLAIGYPTIASAPQPKWSSRKLLPSRSSSRIQANLLQSLLRLLQLLALVLLPKRKKKPKKRNQNPKKTTTWV